MKLDRREIPATTTHNVAQHLRLLFRLGILVRVLVAFLAFLASYLPPFDSSADVLLEDTTQSLFKRWIATTFRWDSFHFLHIALNYYKFEHEWAFFPGVPFISRTSGSAVNLLLRNPLIPSIYTMLWSHYLLATALTFATTNTLYMLTLQHTGSSNIALLSSCMFLLSSSPATLTLAPYAEPWFASLSYKGMLYCSQKRWLWASLSFTLACSFRSNGVFLGGFIVWGMIIEPLITRRRVTVSSVFLCIILSVLPMLPFISFQAAGYNKFCADVSSSTFSWCNRRLPIIYSHVQSYYWDVGFLRYWTIQQLPNFVLASPVLVLLLYYSSTHILYNLNSILFPSSKLQAAPPHPLLRPSILPHAIHTFVITCMLLFASHTQIILRLASSMPFTYWSAARLFYDHPKWAKVWVAWSIVWGSVSVVLWTAFLPPA